METKVDVTFLVGEEAKIVKDELTKLNYGGKLMWFENADQAGLPLQNTIAERDTILIKGSQAARMEKIVKEIMAEPMLSDQLLVRQTKKWLDKA
jgi:UDP-N-acetylmuramyl pentapeptide synthase